MWVKWYDKLCCTLRGKGVISKGDIPLPEDMKYSFKLEYISCSLNLSWVLQPPVLFKHRKIQNVAKIKRDFPKKEKNLIFSICWDIPNFMGYQILMTHQLLNKDIKRFPAGVKFKSRRQRDFFLHVKRSFLIPKSKKNNWSQREIHSTGFWRGVYIAI